MTQYGFYIDQSRCIGCNACTVSCMQWHHILPGSVKWMRIHQWEKGSFPNVRVHILPVMCYHCENPVCVKACPHQAISKEPRFGAVLVDAERCRGARKCWMACPYGAPQFASSAPDTKMTKCTMCIDRLNQGLTPLCVLSCSMRALEFGKLDDLQRKYGTVRQLEDMPKESITSPAIVLKPADRKKQVIPWDHLRSLVLWQKRDPPEGVALPDFFADEDNVTKAPHEIVGRNRLVLKPKSPDELKYFTTDDE